MILGPLSLLAKATTRIGENESTSPGRHENRLGRRARTGRRQPESRGVSPSDGTTPEPPAPSTRSPLFEAQQAPRYARQQLICEYQEANACRLVVMKDYIFPHSITPFEDTLFDANPDEDLHLILDTLGGDGETALRLIRQAQSRCRELTVIVPDQAKSAGTLFALGAHQIYMGPTSDLGPIDPQLMLPDNSIVAARAIIDAVEEAERRIQQNPATYPLHVSLLESVTALTVQQARDELDRTDDLLRAALACPSTRCNEEINDLVQRLRRPLIETKSHGAVISARDASGFGMPVEEAEFASSRWQAVWRLWTKYAVLNAARVYEGRTASYISYS